VEGGGSGDGAPKILLSGAILLVQSHKTVAPSGSSGSRPRFAGPAPRRARGPRGGRQPVGGWEVAVVVGGWEVTAAEGDGRHRQISVKSASAAADWPTRGS
jgi:hypothetical protein